RQELEGYRAFSASRQTQVNLRAAYAPDELSRLTLVLNAIDQPLAQSPGALPIDSVRADPRMAWPNNVLTRSGEKTRQGQAGVAYTRSIGGGQLDVAGYALARSVENPLPFGFIELTRRGGGVRAAWSTSTTLATLPLALTAGADADLQSDDRREYDNAGGRPGSDLRRDQVDRVAAVGPFVQAELQLTPTLVAMLGGRYDAVRFRTTDAFLGDGDDSGERTLDAFSPVAGLTYAASPTLRVYANVATSFQTPTTTELINAPPAPGEECCPAGFNTQLEPQRAVSYEVGVKGEIAGRVLYDVAVYHMDLTNALVPFQVAGAESREFFRNSGRTRHRGVEIGASGTIQRLALTGAYTFSDFSFVDDGLDGADFEGNEFPGVPPHHLFLGARFDAGRRVTLDARLDHTSEYFATDANDPASANPAATVVDLRVLFATRFGGLGVRPFIALNNVFDERYNSSVVLNAFGARYFEPAPGRNLAVGLTLGTGGWAR
ncbi:MAG: TonB-dependent receptor family protein, partial [Longimicrobiales bacterium]